VTGFASILERFAGKRLLVLGDLILDRYWWGECTRLSPEAPVPVVRKRKVTVTPGGAANTAANLAALGARVELIGLTGRDEAAAELKAALEEHGVSTDCLMETAGRPTTTKTRIIALHQQLVRVDDEDTSLALETQTAEALRLAGERLPAADAVVISDYAKGFLAPPFLKCVLAMAREAGKPVFVDPKGMDWTRYSGCTLIKPNRAELSLLTGMSAHDHEETLAAGRRLAVLMPGSLVLVTEGAEGMTLFSGTGETHVEPVARQVYDVTGAGDAVLAVTALALSAGASHLHAMQLASHAASIVIGRVGTVVVSRDELLRAITAGGEPAQPQQI
jgi:rfaE bifunctional protein kinase chain/domain